MDVENKEESYLLNRIKIRKDDLNNEMVIQPKLVAIAGGKLEALQAKLDLLDHQIEVLESQLYVNFLKKLVDEKPTQKLLDSKVKSDKRVRALKSEYLNVAKTLGMVKARYKALLCKTEMLKEIAYNTRKELEQGVIRKKSRIKEKSTMD